MSAVKSAMELVGSYDWNDLMAHITLLESLPSSAPAVYADMLNDPQWELKKELFMAASQFSRALGEIEDRLEKSNAG